MLFRSAHVPYGNKSNAEIKALVTSAARRMKEQKIDALVMACNTAAAVAIEEVQIIMGLIPVLGVVEAGVETVLRELKAMSAKQSTPTLVLATKATVKSAVYSNILKKKRGQDFYVIEQDCPLLVSMIEEGCIDDKILRLTLAQYLAPYIDLEPGICLLGCTHYPWIKSSIENILPKWKILDSSVVLSEKLLTRMINFQNNENHQGSTVYMFTDPNAIPAFVQASVKDYLIYDLPEFEPSFAISTEV